MELKYTAGMVNKDAAALIADTVSGFSVEAIVF